MNDYLVDSCATCAKKCEVFQALSKEELDRMYQNRYEAHFRAGEVIVKQESPISHLISISSGITKLVLETPGKPDIILTLQKAVNLISSPGIFHDNRYHFSVVALTPIRACYIDVQYLHEFMDSNQQFARSYYKHIGEQAILLYDRIRSLNQKNMAGRISEALLFLYNKIHQENPFKVILTRQEFADFSGMTKESVSRILKEFKEEQIIDVDDQTFHILELERLESIARTG